MSNQTIKCPTCQTEISIDDVFTHQLEEKIRKESEEKQKIKDIEISEKEKTLMEKSQKLENDQKILLTTVNQQVEEKVNKEKLEIEKVAREKAIEKVRIEYSEKIESVKSEGEERDRQNKSLREQVSDLIKQLREMKSRDDQRDIEYQKKLLDEEASIKNKAKQEAAEESQLQIAQKEKQLDDLRKQLSEAQRKAEQGSQQTQGEVLELELEELLRQKFIYDEILPVPKGINGADVIQKVKSNSGRLCGTIVWESKRTKNWVEGWISKLNEDKRREKGDLAVIVSTILPDNIKSFDIRDGVVITNFQSVMGIATLLRNQLFRISEAKISNEDREKKSEVVYSYLISNEFKQRIEVWLEYFKSRQNEITKERAYYSKKWEKEEKSIQRIFENTAGIYGDLQGMIGNALPRIETLELPEGEPEKS